MTGFLRPGRLVATTAAILCAAAGLSAPASAQPPASAPVLAAPGVARSATAPANTRVTFTFGMPRAEQAAIHNWELVSDPTSPSYRHFLTREDIRTAFGAQPANVAELSRQAVRFGLRVELDPTGVFAQVTGTARNWRRWVGTPVIRQQLPASTVGGGGTSVAYTLRNPRLPRALRSLVTEFYPVDLVAAYPSAQFSGIGPGALVTPTADEYPNHNLGTPASCVPALLSRFVYSTNQLNTAYGVDQLPVAPNTTPRVAILSQGDGFSPAGLAEAARCFGQNGVAVTVTSVAGLSGPLPVGLEGELDIQTVQSVLPPESTVDIVASTIFDPREYLPWATAFALPNLPDAVTTSYSICEADLDSPSASLANSVLLRLAVAGVSTFAAAGDSGSSGCWRHADQSGPRALAVQFPSSSPYVTAVGGSRLTLDAANRRTAEVVWNDSELQAPPLTPMTIAGGGGASRIFDQPWFQRTASTGSVMRAVPDLAVHSSFVPGWPTVATTSLTPVAGTSAASPYVAAVFARMTSLERAAGKPRLGNVSGLLYHQATTQPGAFFDIVSGNNDLFRRGCCTAGPGYDRASGLGAPNFASIYAGLPATGGTE
ncbi:MAG: S53 family peptidase [Candidatus Nanopelagicales bacterium]